MRIHQTKNTHKSSSSSFSLSNLNPFLKLN